MDKKMEHNAPAALGTKARITAFPQSRVLPEAAGALPKTGIVSVLGNVSGVGEVGDLAALSLNFSTNFK